ncbi:MAG TPA: LytTR family DNA-binding domain-containing protein [Gemmatimonadaceae bacterium]|nr:LytTR family DNA-binding domain-containing protein [Gemmatimonadaceae bacterium]
MKHTVLIVEDEAPALKRLTNLVKSVDWLELAGQATDGKEAVRMIDSLLPDLVFLDIQLPEVSGIDVVRTVKHKPLFVFTTAHDRYAVPAFELQALDYLLKPFGEERFLAAATRARKALGNGADPESTVDRVSEALSATQEFLTRIFVRDRGKITPILVRAIDRLESDDDYVAVFAGGRRYLVYLPLSEFVRRLDPAQFLRIHRSHVVNLDFVDHFESFDAGRLKVTMRDGTSLMASRVRSKELRHLAI